MPAQLLSQLLLARQNYVLFTDEDSFDDVVRIDMRTASGSSYSVD